MWWWKSWYVYPITERTLSYPQRIWLRQNRIDTTSKETVLFRNDTFSVIVFMYSQLIFRTYVVKEIDKETSSIWIFFFFCARLQRRHIRSLYFVIMAKNLSLLQYTTKSAYTFTCNIVDNIVNWIWLVFKSIKHILCVRETLLWKVKLAVRRINF